MRVTVQLFARLRELAGRAEMVVEVPAASTVADVWRAVEALAPGVSALSTSMSAAVNLEFAAMTTPVLDDDEIAFLPPVSGGAGS